MATEVPPSGVLERYRFDTVFDGGGDVIASNPRPKRTYTSDEVEQIRRAAEAQGQAQALAGVAARQSDALNAIARACQQALPRLAAVAHEHREGSAELSLACAQALAAAALDKFPQAPVQAALAALAREIEAAPRLIVTCDADLAEGLQGVLDETAQSVGFPGAIQVRVDPEQAARAFTLDFGDGSASFDPQASAERVAQALHAALAAEGLHAEPIIPGAAGDVPTAP